MTQIVISSSILTLLVTAIACSHAIIPIPAAPLATTDAFIECPSHMPRGVSTAVNVTACDVTLSTCCNFKWSPNGYGCCQMPDAVCCGNGYTCCPSGHTCSDAGEGYGVVTTCVPDTSLTTVATIGQEICKLGPSLPFSNTLKNCLIIGDSVSIGYTPYVAELLSDVCLVQHSPWDVQDGGACETAYGLQCINSFLSTPSGLPLIPDLIYFNWGLHNGPLGQSTLPGQNGNSSTYAAELQRITDRFLHYRENYGTVLVYGLTTPMLCNRTADDIVVMLNTQAHVIMTNQNIPTINLHDAIVNHCGPIGESSCFGDSNCFCPHCVSAGYRWLATSTIAPFIRQHLNADQSASLSIS